MREIKFRAWHRESKTMCDVLLICFVNKYVDVIPEWDLEGGNQHSWGFEEIDLMQSTGIKDKNDIELYEGDIVSVMDYDYQTPSQWEEEDPRWKDGTYTYLPLIEKRRDVVSTEFFRYFLKNEEFGYEGEGLDDPKKCVVIGNIHETPELLQP